MESAQAMRIRQGGGILHLLQIPLRKYFFPKFSFFENRKSFVKKSCFENFKNNFRPISSVKCKVVKKRVWYPFTEENEKKSVFLKICTYIKTKIDLRFYLMRISPVITTVAVVTSSLNSSKNTLKNWRLRERTDKIFRQFLSS